MTNISDLWFIDLQNIGLIILLFLNQIIVRILSQFPLNMMLFFRVKNLSVISLLRGIFYDILLLLLTLKMVIPTDLLGTHSNN